MDSTVEATSNFTSDIEHHQVQPNGGVGSLQATSGTNPLRAWVNHRVNGYVHINYDTFLLVTRRKLPSLKELIAVCYAGIMKHYDQQAGRD